MFRTCILLLVQLDTLHNRNAHEMLSTPANPTSQGEYFSRFLDETGDGSGNKDAIGDYSAVVTDFLITPPVNNTFDIFRLLVQIADTGPIDAGFYGNNIVLTNGIRLLLLDNTGTIITDYVDTMPIITNANWARFAFDAKKTDFGAGQNYIDIRWTFQRGGRPLRLRNQSLAVRLNDDFTSLTSHTFLMQGLSLT